VLIKRGQTRTDQKVYRSVAVRHAIAFDTFCVIGLGLIFGLTSHHLLVALCCWLPSVLVACRTCFLGIRVRPETVTIVQGLRTTTVPWNAIDSFRIVPIGRQPSVIQVVLKSGKKFTCLGGLSEPKGYKNFGPGPEAHQLRIQRIADELNQQLNQRDSLIPRSKYAQ
jgi:hypothetical protein